MYLKSNLLIQIHLIYYLIFKASALWADDFYKSKCPSVCLSVCLCVCSLLRYIALQQTRQDSLPQVKLGKTLNLRLFGVCF
jgi:hypothetical protein